MNTKKYKQFQIKVSITGTQPLVWRRLLIPEGITFHELNSILQIAFEWSGYHQYQFEIGSMRQNNLTFIALPWLEEFIEDNKLKDSEIEKIDKYIINKEKIKYIYDLGDWWKHEIIVEKIIEEDKKLEHPVCIKAKGACLPEDCGGAPGYKRLLKILKDKNDEENEEMMSWVNQTCFNWDDDREYVDLEKINFDLEDFDGYAEMMLENKLW